MNTSLQKNIYTTLHTIPKGKLITYKLLAKKVGTPKAVRRVATIVGQNPEPISTPCHRVIRSDGKVGEYTYKGIRDADRKIALLKKEGIEIVGDRVVNMARYLLR